MVWFDHRRAAFFCPTALHPAGGAPEKEPTYPDISLLSIRFVECSAIWTPAQAGRARTKGIRIPKYDYRLLPYGQDLSVTSLHLAGMNRNHLFVVRQRQREGFSNLGDEMRRDVHVFLFT
jgi:hypothetical protein